MWETLIAVAVVALLLSVGAMHRFMAWFTLLRMGAWLVVAGVALSVAAGLMYHAALYRCLKPRQALNRLWWLSPTRLHRLLLPEERGMVLPWFFLGALGFVVVMLGCVTVLLSVWQQADVSY